MPFTGQLGTPDSRLGNLQLGVAGTAASASASGFFTVTDTGAGAELFSLSTNDAESAADVGAGVDSFSLTDLTPHLFPCSLLGVELGPRQYRQGPEHYLPSWTTAHAERTGKLFLLLQHLAEQSVAVQQEARRAALRQWLGEAEVGERRLQWGVRQSLSPGRDMLLTYATVIGSAVVSGAVRQAISPFDFDTAVDPVWYATPTDLRIWLRNLHMRQVTAISPNPVYSICEEQLAGMVPDAGIFYRRSTENQWEWLSPESPLVTGTIYFSLPASGVWQLAYGSQRLLTALNASGTITTRWTGGQSVPLPLLLQRPANVFDSYGALIGIPRFLQEDNRAYKRRLLSEMEAPGDPTLGGVVRGICSRLGKLIRVVWDGTSDLALDATGASGITFTFLPQVDQLRQITEPLTPLAGLTTQFIATYSNWQNGYLVLVDGVPEGNTSLAGNIVTLSRLVSGAVTATYSVRQYDLDAGPSGFISGIRVGTGLASGAYSVFCSCHVNARVVDLPSYQRSFLLTAAGLPNQLFLELARQLTESNPTTFGRARWGPGAYWFTGAEDQPQSARLPVPMDVGAL